MCLLVTALPPSLPPPPPPSGFSRIVCCALQIPSEEEVTLDQGEPGLGISQRLHTYKYIGDVVVSCGSAEQGSKKLNRVDTEARAWASFHSRLQRITKW